MSRIVDTLKTQLNDINSVDIARPPFIPSERAKINVGYKCNSKCYFCYYHISRLKEETFSIDAIRHQLTMFKEFGAKDVDFSGGDPSVHPDLFEMLKLASDMGFRKICVITNGFKFGDLDFMKRCIDNGLNDILISLHGDSQVNDAVMRVANAFNMTVKAIENAKHLGIKPRVNTVITRRNYRNLPKLAKILNNLEPFNHNIIGFKHCYEQVKATNDKTVRHSEMSPYLIEAMGIETKIPFVNIRYIPFCFAKGYEKNISNYPQKIYDPLEWINTLLPMVDHYSEENFYKCSIGERDKISMNNDAVNCNRFLYTKESKCITCKNLFICDGFEIEYAKKYDVDEADPYEGKPTKDPLLYRYEYYKDIYGDIND